MKIHLCTVALIITLNAFAAPPDSNKPAGSPAWSESAAARYLDSRQVWWQSWPKSKRDHETVCVSCHTVLPYALSRSLLHSGLGEHSPAEPEDILLSYVRKRVNLWNEVEPYYSDAKSGPNKSVESRATESVLNALVLASFDSGKTHLTDLAKAAFDNAWTLQLKTGEKAGAWDWQVFHLAPWESEESQYQGATFMALAVGLAPDQYRDQPGIQSNLQALRSYLKREYATQPLENKIVLLWASTKLNGLLTADDRKTLLSAIATAQHADGGWSLSDLGNWKRNDGTALESQSDGYATGLIVLALHEAGMKRGDTELKSGLAWLSANQNKEDGSWQAYSVNKKRDPTTEVGHFMTDAATGYAVLALETCR